MTQGTAGRRGLHWKTVGAKLSARGRRGASVEEAVGSTRRRWRRGTRWTVSICAPGFIGAEGGDFEAPSSGASGTRKRGRGPLWLNNVRTRMRCTRRGAHPRRRLPTFAGPAGPTWRAAAWGSRGHLSGATSFRGPQAVWELLNDFKDGARRDDERHQQAAASKWGRGLPTTLCNRGRRSCDIEDTYLPQESQRLHSTFGH